MSDIHEQISSLSLSDLVISESPSEIEHLVCTPTTPRKDDKELRVVVAQNDTESQEVSDSEIDLVPSGKCEAHYTQIRDLQLRLEQLEDRLAEISEKDARREAEILLIKAENEARLQALEDRISEIHSRVLVMQEGLVRSGTIQRRQRA